MEKPTKGIQRRDFLKSGLAATASTIVVGSGLIQGDAQVKDNPQETRALEDSRTVMLDTEALIWADRDDDRLGTQSRQMLDAALGRGLLYVSAVSFWEVFSLARAQRIEMDMGVGDWRRGVLDAGVRELGVDGIIGIPEDDELDGQFFHGAGLSIRLNPLLSTPRDRLISTPPVLLGSLIVASAIRLRATFITSDAQILDWSSGRYTLNRWDAQI